MLRILLLLFVCVNIHAGDDSSPEVTIQQGKLRGFKLTSRKGRDFFAFQRIPYVKSPVGNLRFQSPQPLEKWEGVLDATKDIPECPQRNIFMQKFEISGEEDCLYINVYTPQIDKNNPLDVLVYIHGGGWVAFSSADGAPQHFMDKDVVLVTFNYRLGPLGYTASFIFWKT
ncbi:Venom carboxylesterase-6 [Blattella germanica]|nr:Venom carboxylesterase-6 [Blattella germanica]